VIIDGSEFHMKKYKANKTHTISLKAIDICRPIIALNSSRTLLDARNSMLRYKISRIVVSFNGKSIGIVTEKDIANFLYDIPAKQLSETALKDITQKKSHTVNESSTIGYCCKLMLQKNISSLIVNDGQGKNKGIITKTDIVGVYAYHHQPSHIPVYECMSDKVYSVGPYESIHMIALLMDIHNISRVIVQKIMKPIGIVTSKDFLPISLFHGTKPPGRHSTTLADTNLAKKKQRFIPSGIIEIICAKDIMTPAPITIHKDVDIAEAAKLMISNRISGLPVINAKHHLIGIITKTDILKSTFSQ
jgi:CBS domain-containing protein